MKKIVITYGLIAGTIVGAMLIITMQMYQNGTLDSENGKGELIGYTTMIIALSMIFFGIKSYRDNYLEGIISFKKGAQIGILIALIASIMYGLAWEISYSQIGKEFTNKMTESYLEKLDKKDMPEKEKQEAKEKWIAFGENYKNPVFRFAVTLTEILPVGILITLISAGLFSRKGFLKKEESVAS